MKLMVTSSPHIHSGETTSRLMRDVLVALIPVLAAAVWWFGVRALTVTVVSVLSCAVSEWVYRMVTRQNNTLSDGSAVVTGVLLAMTLPVSVPYWMVVVGGVFAMVVVKGLVGGLGQNIFNPALAARAFLMLFWPEWLVRYAPAGTHVDAGQLSVDMVSSATPLHHMQMPALPQESVLDMFLGNMGGSMGEVCTLAILVGGGYLLARRVISWRIPVAYLGSVAVLALVFAKGEDPVLWMVYSLLGGGLMLGAFFMATDYATSPVTPQGQLVYGVGCGVLTVVFRYFGHFPEGITYAILLMNAGAWVLDELTPPQRFGTEKGGVSR